MVSFNKFNSFVEAVAEKAHNLGADQIKLALSASAPSAANTVLANITEVSYTNLSTRNVSTASSAQSSGLYKLVLTDLILSASGGSVAAFRYVVVYNDTAASDELIGWYDYGSSLTLADGESLTVDFDGTNGALSIQ